MVKYVKDNKTYTLNEIIKENPGRGFNEDLDLEEFGYVPLRQACF
jgi:hypothetical protein